jgi:hypothetical protein
LKVLPSDWFPADKDDRGSRDQMRDFEYRQIHKSRLEYQSEQGDERASPSEDFLLAGLRNGCFWTHMSTKILAIQSLLEQTSRTSAGALYSAACQVPCGSVRIGKLLFPKPSSAAVNDGARAITKNDESAKNNLLIVDFRGSKTNTLLVSRCAVKETAGVLLRMSKDARGCFLYT